MDEKTKINPEEYFKKLPKPVQDFIATRTWETRVFEIAKKYSLNQGQSENLADIVLTILVGLENPENFQRDLPSDLKISNLISEQIIKELDTRVFDLAIKSVEKKNEKGPERNPEKTIMPAIQKPEQVKPPTPAPLPKEVTKPNEPAAKPKNLLDILSSKPAANTSPVFSQMTKPPIPPIEPPQKPTSVPRFNLDNEVAKGETREVKPPSVTPTKVMPAEITAAKTETPKVENRPTHEYTVDPYREPLE